MVIDGKQVTKVVHVHFIHGHANYYFGSVHAVFKKFSFDDIGCCEGHLRACLSEDGNKYLNDKVLIVRSHLLR